MKRCLSCDIKIGGQAKVCPLCQNALMGKETPGLWPAVTDRLKYLALLNKIQLFIVLSAIVVCVVIDFFVGAQGRFHWSVAVVLWALAFEAFIHNIMRGRVTPVRLVTLTTFGCLVILIVTSWYFGFWGIFFHYIAPISLSAVLTFNFVMCLADRSENAMVYLLVNILVGAVTYVIQIIVPGDILLPWSICLMITLITFIGMAVFKGRSMVTEIQKRLHF